MPFVFSFFCYSSFSFAFAIYKSLMRKCTACSPKTHLVYKGDLQSLDELEDKRQTNTSDSDRAIKWNRCTKAERAAPISLTWGNSQTKRRWNSKWRKTRRRNRAVCEVKWWMPGKKQEIKKDSDVEETEERICLESADWTSWCINSPFQWKSLNLRQGWLNPDRPRNQDPRVASRACPCPPN